MFILLQFYIQMLLYSDLTEPTRNRLVLLLHELTTNTKLGFG